MAEPRLDSLRIQNFRAFRELEIPALGRVNLIVGKNNSGKSSILEALSIYAREGHPDVILDILGARGESSRVIYRREQDAYLERRALDIKYIFHNRPDLADTQEIHIGPLHQAHKQLSLAVGWYPVDERGRKTDQRVMFDEPDELLLIIQFGERPEISYNLARYLARWRSPSEEIQRTKCIFIPADGLRFSAIATLWDSITLTDLDKQVIQALQIIEPSIEGLSFIGSETGNGREPVVRTSRYQDRLPLRSLGEGVNRLLGIALTLVNATDGLLLIDEIESGLHYSIQPDMWRLVFQVASELNIQVFATTHSKDCLEAFQSVSSAHPDKGILIRLGRKQNDIVASVFAEDDLEIAIQQDVEVR